MSNELTIPGSSPATLLEIRMDSKRFPRLSSYSRQDAIAQMAKIVSMAFLYKGQQADPNNISFISSALVDELLQEDTYHPRALSFEEIARVVKKAVLTEEMYGISVASLYRVILDFCKGEGHRIQAEASELKRKQDEKALRESVIAPMLQAYTGEFVRNNKLNK